MSEIDQVKARIAAQVDKFEEVTEVARTTAGRARATLGQLPDLLERELAANASAIAELMDRLSPLAVAGWDDDAWHEWLPSHALYTGALRAGEYTERGHDLMPYPAVRFVGGTGIVVRSDAATEARGDALTRSLLLRSVLSQPHHVKLWLLDPSGLGSNWRHVKRLPGVMPTDEDVRRTLDQVLAHIRHVNRTYLDGAYANFHELPETQRRAEDFRLVALADFPRSYDARAIEAVKWIAKNGPATGVHLLVHEIVDPKEPSHLPTTMQYLDVRSTSHTQGGLDVEATWDIDPPDKVADDVLEKLAAAVPEEAAVDWADLHGDVDFWAGDTTKGITVPIGRSGVSDRVLLEVGSGQRVTAAHGILAGGTGLGKSTMLRSLVAGLAHHYSPDELDLRLIDGKDGVEFRVFEELPHARVVSLRTNPVVARSILHELIDEMARRNALFDKVLAHDGSGSDAAGDVADFSTYRAAGHSMPRILVVVDEYQDLSLGDEDREASTALEQLAAQGRSAGIHLLLSSQLFRRGNFRHDEILPNIGARIAMGMPSSEISSLIEFDREGRERIEQTCDRAGKFVANPRGGADGANIAGQGALITDQQRRGVVTKSMAEHGARPTVLRGDDQPPPDVMLPWAADHTEARDPKSLQSLARRPVTEGGFGEQEWLAPERPLLLPIGRALSVSGQMAVTVRRAADENVVLVADQDTLRIPVLATMVAGAATMDDRGAPVSVRIIDMSLPGTTWHGLLPRVADGLAALGVDVACTTDRAGVDPALEAVAAEVQARNELKDLGAGEPSMLLVVNAPDRAPSLLMVEDDFGDEPSASGRDLLQVLRHGPMCGVHTIMAAASVSAVWRVLPERQLRRFQHRLATQLSDQDAFDLMEDSTAARLGLLEPPRLGAYQRVARAAIDTFVPAMLDPDHSDPAAFADGLVALVAEARQ